MNFLNLLPVITVVKGDDLPNIRVQVTDRNTSLPVNLSGTGITARGLFKKEGETETIFAHTMTKVDGGIYGWLNFAWPSGGTDQTIGVYELQVEVTFSGLVQTMPTVARINLIDKFTEPA